MLKNRKSSRKKLQKCNTLYGDSSNTDMCLVLSVTLRYTDSDYPFGIFKLFLSVITLRIVSISAPNMTFPTGVRKGDGTARKFDH